MSSLTQVPVTVSREVTEFVAQQGLQEPFREMLDRALQLIPRMRRIEVTLQYSHDEDLTRVLIDAVVEPDVRDFSIDLDLGMWRLEQYPPHVAQHFVHSSCPDYPDAR